MKPNRSYTYTITFLDNNYNNNNKSYYFYYSYSTGSESIKIRIDERSQWQSDKFNVIWFVSFRWYDCIATLSMEGTNRSFRFRIFFVPGNRLLRLYWCRFHFMLHTNTKWVSNCNITHTTECHKRQLNSIQSFLLFRSLYPISVLMGKMTANYRYHLVGHTDARIRIINEIIQGIQTIKFYAWEKPFANIVDQIRR